MKWLLIASASRSLHLKLAVYNGKTLTAWVNALQSPDEKGRLNASRTLATLGPKAYHTSERPSAEAFAKVVREMIVGHGPIYRQQINSPSLEQD